MKIKKLLNKLTNGVVYLHTPLKQFTLTSDNLEKEYGLKVRVIDYCNDSDVDLWCHTVNNSYSDMNLNRDSARKFVNEHPYFSETKTFVFESRGG